MTIRLRNVISITDHLAARLWRDQAHLREDDPLRAAVEDHAAGIERLCRRAGGSPSDLPARSRYAYTWLRYISLRENWPKHIDALRRLRRTFGPQPGPIGATEVHLVAMGALWRLRNDRHRPSLLRLHQGFMAADDEFLAYFASAWARKDMSGLNRLSRDFSLSRGFTAVSEELRHLAPEPDASARGKVHDLDASFRRVRAAHFDGKIERPGLRWGSIASKRTFGSYRFSEDRLTVSPRLDASDVPQWLLDFIVFHELLHKEHGITARGSRRYAHTAAFRAAERAHPRHHEAENFLKNLSRKSRGAKGRA